MIRSDDTSRDGGSRFLCVTADSEVSIIVRNSLFPRKFLETRAVIDTGADFSCIPTRMLPPLGFVAYHILRVGDYDGIQRWKLAYYLTIEFFGKLHVLENVVGVEGETVLLGKDLLAGHPLFLLLPAE